MVEENDEYIPLLDGAPFSYTFYQKEDKLEFKYSMKEKKEVNFNLIAPLNTLLLVVDNGPESADRVSSEGYLTYTSD